MIKNVNHHDSMFLHACTIPGRGGAVILLFIQAIPFMWQRRSKQTAKQQQTCAVSGKNMVVKDMKEHNKMKERWEREIKHFAWSYLSIVFILLFLGHLLTVLI